MDSDESFTLATANPSVGGGKSNLTTIEFMINFNRMIAIYCLLGVFLLCLGGIAAPDPITAGIAGGFIGIATAAFLHSYETYRLLFFLCEGVAFVSNYSPYHKQNRSYERG